MAGFGMGGDIDLDLKRLRRDVAKRQAARPVGLAPGGRRSTGSMAVVRRHLAEMEKLRAAGATWADIAAGLAGQGVTQGEGQPITAKRLTALVTIVRKTDAKRIAKTAERERRVDLAASGTSGDTASLKTRPRLGLSPELRPPIATVGDSKVSESALRREAFERQGKFFKKDPG